MSYFDIGDIISSLKWVFCHNETIAFESEFSNYLGIRFSLGTSYGRTALYVGLKAIEVKDKEVIMPAFICTVVRHAVVSAGAIPQFVDINLDNFSINTIDLKNKISNKTKAIIIPHYFGQVARNIEKIIQIAKQNNLVLIEDCAHSLGAEYNGKKIGTFGDFAIFSLTKGLVNFGGGVLATDNYKLFKKAKQILNKEYISLRTRIIDYPLLLSYGLEQFIEKIIFDRLQPSIFKWWLIKVPRFILIIRNYLIRIIKKLFSIKVLENTKRTSLQSHIKNQFVVYNQGLNIEPIVASVSRNQLKKIDYLISRRNKINKALANCNNYHFQDNTPQNIKDVSTYIVLRFSNANIFDIIDHFKESGILLRSTWPTHQELWTNQETENIKTIENEFLLWNVSPMVSKKEITKFKNILNNI